MSELDEVGVEAAAKALFDSSFKTLFWRKVPDDMAEVVRDAARAAITAYQQATAPTPTPEGAREESENFTTCDSCAHIFGLLRLFRKYDLDLEGVHPTHDGRSVGFNCNDFFYWACSDIEVYEPGDLPLLEQCAADLKEAGDYSEVHTTLLFCARKRQMRPQYPFFRKYDRERRGYFEDELNAGARSLFDGCGPDGSDRVGRG